MLTYTKSIPEKRDRDQFNLSNLGDSFFFCHNIFIVDLLCY